MQSLTPSEEQLMLIIWQKSSAYTREIVAAYPDPKPHQNTVSTFLRILTEKGFITAEKEGRIQKYSAAVQKSDYRNYLLKKLAEDYFGNSGREMCQTLIQNKMLVPNETAQENPVADYILELTEGKKGKKKRDKKKKHK